MRLNWWNSSRYHKKKEIKIAWGVKDDFKTYCHEIFKFQLCVLILNSGLKMYPFLLKNCLYGISPLQFGIFKSTKYSRVLKVNEKGRYTNHTWVFVHGLLHGSFSRPGTQVMYSRYTFDSLSFYYKVEMPNLKWLNEKIIFFLLSSHEYAIISFVFYYTALFQ